MGQNPTGEHTPSHGPGKLPSLPVMDTWMLVALAVAFVLLAKASGSPSSARDHNRIAYRALLAALLKSTGRMDEVNR